jgi:hypothetical protein
MIRVVVDVVVSEVDASRIGQVEQAHQAFLAALAEVGILDVRVSVVTDRPLEMGGPVRGPEEVVVDRVVE